MKMTHIDRMKVCAVMLFFSYALIAGLLVYYSDLNNIESTKPNKGILIMVLSLSLWLSGVGAALSESTIVGYLKCFHPDQIEDFGTGQSIGSIGDIGSVFILNNFNITRKFSLYFGWLSLSMIPLLFCFNSLENLRIEQIVGDKSEEEETLLVSRSM